MMVQACSTNSSYKLKKFFFDGVPDPNEQRIRDSINALVVADTLTALLGTQVKKEVEIKGSIHKPWGDRKCFECHDQNNFKKGKIPLLELCFDCHEGYGQDYKIVHGPVSSGHCTSCHNPHLSDFKKLLHSDQQILCLQCHEEKDVFANSYHDSIGENNCVSCHNPHGGNDSNFLNSNSCSECHELVKNEKKYVHGPVETNNCELCHGPHASPTKSVIAMNGNQLCLYCHDEENINSSIVHIENKRDSCIKCHDPHASNEPNLLITSISNE